MCRIGQYGAGGHKVGTDSLEDLEKIKDAIRSKYAQVSISAAGKFQYPTGKDGANALRYDPAIIKSAGQKILVSFCGVGNPFSLGPIQQGDIVLDFGSGAGFDLFVASRLVGKSGRACGVDLTEEMVERARDNFAEAKVSNVEIKKIDAENIPYDDASFDVVISNGVINLSPNKNICFQEIYRVLKPGGKLQFADVVVESEVPSDLLKSPEAWSQ